MTDLHSILDALFSRQWNRVVMITLVAREGSSYRRPGARMAITEDGWSIGAVSGGCLESMIRDHAREVIDDDLPRMIEIDTTSDDDVLFGSSMGCPGKLHFRFEPASRETFESRYTPVRDALAQRRTVELDGMMIEPVTALTIIGAGNDALPIVALARAHGLSLTVVDARESYLTEARFPDPIRRQLLRPSPLSIDRWTGVVLATHNYFLDLDWLRVILPERPAYVGVIGSKDRFDMLESVLRDEGLADELFAPLRGPAGLDIGSETPAEIALAILAEMKAVMAGRSGSALSINSRTTSKRGVAR